MLTASRNKKLLARFIEHVGNNENLDAVDEYHTALYIAHHDPGDPWDGQTLDIAGFKARLKQSGAVAPDQVFKIEDMIGESKKVLAAWTWQAAILVTFQAFQHLEIPSQCLVSPTTISTEKDLQGIGKWLTVWVSISNFRAD